MKSTLKELPVATTIAGSDSGAGAGIQADLLTFAALGVYGTTAITSLTAQNPQGVTAVLAVTPDFLEAQLNQLAGYYKIRAMKTGMLYDAELVRTVCRFIATHPGIQLVVDPVMVSTSGSVLLKDDAIAVMRDKLMPLASLVTPNLDEAGVLLGKKPESVEEMRDAAKKLKEMLRTNILLKGGHLVQDEVTDVFHTRTGLTMAISDPRLPDINTHGSGCTLSAAITAFLAKGESLEMAVGAGRRYLLEGMKNPIAVSGERFIAHMHPGNGI